MRRYGVASPKNELIASLQIASRFVSMSRLGPTHSSHSHTPQEVGQVDQTSMRWRSMKTLNVGEDFFPSVLHVQVHMSEPVQVTCRWVMGQGNRAGDRMCPDIRLVLGTGNLTGNTTTGRPDHPLFPTGFLYESDREGRPPDRSVLNFQYMAGLRRPALLVVSQSWIVVVVVTGSSKSRVALLLSNFFFVFFFSFHSRRLYFLFNLYKLEIITV